MDYKKLIKVVDSKIRDAFNGEAYGTILEDYEASEIGGGDAIEGAKQYAMGIDWSETELEQESVQYAEYVDTVNGVDIYHDYGASYYFFTPSKKVMDSSLKEQKAQQIERWIRGDYDNIAKLIKAATFGADGSATTASSRRRLWNDIKAILPDGIDTAKLERAILYNDNSDHDASTSDIMQRLISGEFNDIW